MDDQETRQDGPGSGELPPTETFASDVASGWITPEITYPSYRAFWKACSSGPDRGKGPQNEGSSFLAFSD